MVELDQFKYTLSTYVPMLKELGASLNLDAKKERIAELSRYMEAPDFWDDPERSQKMTKELKSLEDTVKSYTTLSTQYDDISELIEMGYEENDPEVIPVIQESLDEFTTNLEALRLSTLLDDREIPADFFNFKELFYFACQYIKIGSIIDTA